MLVLKQMRKLVNQTTTCFEWLKDQPDQQAAFLGPYLARSLLEVAMSAIVARCDPFRVLIVREIQASAHYSAGERVKAALQWQGDILPPKDSPELWSIDKEPEKFSRSLLGPYYEHLYWTPAFQRMVDEIEIGRGGAWLSDFRTWGIAGAMKRIRAEVGKLYCTFSKGVHHEILLERVVMFDRLSMASYAADALKHISLIALASHLAPQVHASLPLDAALAAFEKTQETVLL